MAHEICQEQPIWGEMRGHAGGWPAIIRLWSCVRDKRNNWIFFFFYLPQCDLICLYWGLLKEGGMKREKIYSSNFESHQPRKCNVVWQNSEFFPEPSVLLCRRNTLTACGAQIKSLAAVFFSLPCKPTGLVLLLLHECTESSRQWDQWQIHLL